MSEDLSEEIAEDTQAQAEAKLQDLASQIVNDRHLRHILRQVAWAKRHAVYEEIKPYLSFTPKPFFLFRF